MRLEQSSRKMKMSFASMHNSIVRASDAQMNSGSVPLFSTTCAKQRAFGTCAAQTWLE